MTYLIILYLSFMNLDIDDLKKILNSIKINEIIKGILDEDMD